MNKLSTSILALVTLMAGSVVAAPAFGQSAASPYELKVFAKAPEGLSAPDSIAVLDGHAFVGYGDGHAPDGSDGLNSQVVEYTMDGAVVHVYTVPGHNDGLKVDPRTHLLWALQNEDLNPNLVIINTVTHDQKEYAFGPTPHGGGYDDMVFRGCKVYISASNPANNPNNGPAIVSAHLEGNIVDVEPVLAGEASAIDLPTGATIQLNLQDPDSMTLDPLGNLVLDSQADQEILIVSHPGTSNQGVLRLPLSYQTSAGPMSVETDDTAFVTSSEGFFLFADKGLNEVFTLSNKAFAPGTAYTAADGGPFVGRLDLTTGVVTPVVTGLMGPGGMMFVDTSKAGLDRDRDENENACRDRDRDWDWGWDSH
jgi:hypothetical protein